MAKNQGKTRFNIIDVIILIAIIAVVAALIWIAVLQNRPGVFETREVEYTVRISGVASNVVSNINEGDVIWNTDEDTPIGTVMAVRSEKTKYYNTEKTVNANGRLTVRTSEYPDLYDVYVTLSSKAAIAANGISVIDGKRILIGSGLYFHNGKVAEECYVTAFEIIGSDN